VALTWVKGVPHSKIFLNYNTTYTNPFLKLTNEWTSYLDSIYSTVSKD
jgi:hypothetical protein